MASQTVVDRQATFDTDSRIQKGNLKLPVISSTEPELSIISDKSVQLTKTKDVHEKKPLTGKLDAPIVEVHDNKILDKGSVNKSKAKAKEKDTTNNLSTKTKNNSNNLNPSKEPVQQAIDKTSVLKGLNAKRAKSPIVDKKEVQTKQSKGDKDTQKPATDKTVISKVAQVKADNTKKQESLTKQQTKPVQQKQTDNEKDKNVVSKLSNKKEANVKQASHAQNTIKGPSVQNNAKQDKSSGKTVNEIKPPAKQGAQSVKPNTETKLETSKVNNRNDNDKPPSTSKASLLKGVNAKRSSSPVKTSVVTLPKDQPNSKSQKPVLLGTDKPAETKGQSSKRSKSPEKATEKAKNETKTVASKAGKIDADQHISPPRKGNPISSRAVNIDLPIKNESAENKHDKKQSQNKKEHLPINQAPVKTTLDRHLKVGRSDRTENNTYTKVSNVNEGGAPPDALHNKVDIANVKHNQSTDLEGETKESSQRTRNNVTEKVDRNDTGVTYVVSDISRGDLKLRPVIDTRETITEEDEDLKPSQVAKSSPRKMDGQGNLRRETFEQVYAERNTLLNAETAYRQRIKQLEDEANSFLKTIEDLTSENADLRRRVDRLEENGSQSEERNETDHESTQELRDLKAQIIGLQSENHKLNEENVTIKADHYANLKKLHALESDVKTSARGAETKRDKEGDNDNDQLMKEMRQLRDKNAKLETKVKSLEQDNKNLSETLTDKKNELGELLGVMKDENKFDNEIKELNNKVLRLTQEKQELEQKQTKEKRVLNEELNETRRQLEDLSKQLADMKGQNKELEANGDTLVNDNKKLKTLTNAQNGEISDLKQEMAQMKATLKDGSLKYDTLLSETDDANSDLKRAKDELEKFNKELRTIVSEKELQISKLISQLDSVRQEKETERKTNKDLKESMTAEIERLTVFEKNMAHKESELKHYIERNEDSDHKRKQLEIQLEDRGFQMSNLEQQIFELNMKLENGSQRLSQLDKDKREMENDRREWEVKRDKFNDIEASNKRLLDENRRLRGQMESASFSHGHRPPPTEHVNENVKPVKEAWTAEQQHQKQQAVLVLREKKKVHLATEPQGNGHRQRVPHVKSSPVKSNKQPSTRKEAAAKTVTNSSRSLEDLRRTPIKSPVSEHSLPELRHPPSLTYAGGIQGYSQIHRDRVRAAHKRIY